MSNDILGSVVSNDPPDATRAQLNSLSTRTPLGLFVVTPEEVESTVGRFFAGVKQANVVNFCVTDGPRSRNATYLVDGIDYAEGNSLSLPARSAERLALLVELVHAIFEKEAVVEVYLALMDSSQLDEMRGVLLAEFSETILSDMDRFSPPDTVYQIRRV